VLAFLILAENRVTGQNEQAPPSDGIGIGIIIAVLIAVAILGFLLFTVMARRSAASKGGVQPPLDETGQHHPGTPPLESIEPRS
jgi:hypothetical protein